jgi:hypothetical protein
VNGRPSAPGVARIDFTSAASSLTAELRTWRLELGRDVTRARDRGQAQLAADLVGLLQRVETVLELGEAIAGAGAP